MIAKETVEAVKELGVAEVVGRYVELKRRGSVYECCCPFHAERTPSFKVSPLRNGWHCFGCGRGGSAVDFVMEHEGLDFAGAVTRIARDFNIDVRQSGRKPDEAEMQAHKHREAMRAVMAQMQNFFEQQLKADTEEAARAREAVYKRWPAEFCEAAGIGYAPRDSRLFWEYVQANNIDRALLEECGMVARPKDGGAPYPVFRERFTIPIADRYDRIIGYTARYVGDNEAVRKYINTAETLLYMKRQTVYALSTAARAVGRSKRLIIVEGAADVLTCQSIGVTEAVAPLGTALTKEQLQHMRKICNTLCFIPDGDVPKPGAAWGAGVETVMKNGLAALARGFEVNVRELPQQFAESTDTTVKTDADGNTATINMTVKTPVKADPGSYFTDRGKFDALDEEPFVVWYAKKLFKRSQTTSEQSEAVGRVASALILVDNETMRDICVDAVSKLFGRPKLWRDAMKQATRRLRDGEDGAETGADDDGEVSGKEAQMLRKFGIIIRNNMYYSPNKDGELWRWSNFILRPVLHVKSNTNAVRVFRIVNEYGQEDTVELTQKELINLGAFQTRIESKGNYIWKAKIEQLNTLREYMYAITESAEAVDVMGWNRKGEYYAWANGLFIDGRFVEADRTGIVRSGSHSYYLPAFSDIYADDETAFNNEKNYRHDPGNGISLYDFCKKVIDVFGDGGRIGCAYVFTSLFRSFIKPINGSFPIFNLFGPHGSGKTALALTLASWFYRLDTDPPKITSTSDAAACYYLAHARDSVFIFDEYTNNIDDKKIDLIKAMWGGAGSSRMNVNGDNRVITKPVYTGVIMCGQELPTRRIAVYSRCIHVEYTRTDFNLAEKDRFTDLKRVADLGNGHLVMQLLGLREVFEKNFQAMYEATQNDLFAALAEDHIHDRIFRNWAVVLAAFRTLEPHISVPFDYKQMFGIFVRGMRKQNAAIAKNSELSEFWQYLDALHMQGRVVERSHYVIKPHNEFQGLGMKEPVRFDNPTRVLYLNFAALQAILPSRQAQRFNAPLSLDVSSLDSYLRASAQFLGTKQQRFQVLLPNGMPDVSVESDHGRIVRQYKEVRPKALCFDYEMIKRAYDVNLETFVGDGEADGDEADAAVT